MKSPAYWHPMLYDLAVRFVWKMDRKTLLPMWDAVSALIPDNTSVSEVGAGTGLFYREYLHGRPLRYAATDINPTFVRFLNRQGIDASIMDLRVQQPRAADTVLMLQVLYNFGEFAGEVLSKALRSARRQVIIVEPTGNSLDRRDLRNRVKAWLVDAGDGPVYSRFTAQELLHMCNQAGVITTCRALPGNLQLVCVIGHGNW